MPLILDGTLGETFPSWTTATRPASPAVGQMGYNTTTGLFDQYTAGGWSSVNTSAGSVIQVVNSQTAISQVSTSSTSYVTTGISVSITPKFATSKIYVVYTGMGYISGTGGYITLYRGSTNLESSSNGFSSLVGSGLYIPVAINALDSPATTSTTTYTLYFKVLSGSTIYAGLTSTTNSFTLMEIAG